MRVELTSNFPAFMAAFRAANTRRRVALKDVLAKHGSDYIRTLVTTQMSGRGGATGGLAAGALSGMTSRNRNKAIAAARAALGADAAGLNRVTGFGARSWYRIVTQRGDLTELVVFTTASYLRFHADDYVPTGGLRRFPARLRAGALWREKTGTAGLIQTLDQLMLRRRS